VAKQIAKLIRQQTVQLLRGGAYKGWQQDIGPDPWGQDFGWAQDVDPPWGQSSAKVDVVARVNPATRSVKSAMRKAKGTRKR
jgi:hypothetical protein